ncbi:MAG TPA: hypothetical protein VGQ95_06635 [Chthoniobacterales bacterium]|nr:hypothetical protein [Chthoniobacterales bacterium]
MKTAVPVLVFSLIASSVVAQYSPGLQISARLLRDKARLDEPVPIEIKVLNTSDKPIYVYGDLNYFITLFASTLDGKGLPQDFIRETMAPPPSKEDFSRLEPGHFLGTIWNQSLKDLGIRASGRYRLDFEFRSNFDSALAFGLSVWRGRASTTLEITVEP